MNSLALSRLPTIPPSGVPRIPVVAPPALHLPLAPITIASKCLALLLILLLPSDLAAAQEPAPAEEAADDTIEEVIVRAHHALAADGWAQPVDVLAGEELDDKRADSIGATIGQEPGIHSTSFGPAVGRPVIHGLEGSRVRVTEDDIDTMDISTTSGDHVVTVDPFLVEEISVYKGATTLLHGPGAIGGVVDIHTGRIPLTVPKELNGRLEVRGGDNGDGRGSAFRLDGGGSGFAWHFDGSWRRADDVEIPGLAESAYRHALEEEEEHEDEDEHGEGHDDEHEDEHEDEDEHAHEDEEDEMPGLLAGSYLEAKSGAFGASMFGERGMVGLSVSRFESDYGLPGHSHAHDHHEEDEHHDEEGEDHDDEADHDEHGDEEDDHHDEEGEEEGSAYIDLTQTRVTLEANVRDPLPNFSGLNFRFGVNDYHHFEVEPNGVVGTEFNNEAWEGWLELRHDAIAGFDGVLGTQFGDRRFSAVGEESLVPPNDTKTFGVFWVGQKQFDRVQLEAGLRFDRVRHEPEGGAERSFSGGSASLGTVMPLANDWTGTLLLDYASRAPVSEELYSHGPHLATSTFEIGDPTLDTETALNFSATVGRSGEKWSALATAYFITFGDFIYQRDTGEERDELPVRYFEQADATFAGFEIEASVVAAEWDGGQLALDILYDAVNAEVDATTSDNPPRLPPHRVGVGADIESGRLSLSLNYLRFFEQDEIASYELPTDAYDDLRAQLAWKVETQSASVDLFVRGRNLTDAEQRHHTSFVKDLAPAPGRTLEAGVRVAF